MSIGRRISITVYSALALGIDVIGIVLSDALSGRGPGPNAWLVAFFVLTGLAILGVFFVYRWWSLLPALTTVSAFWIGNAIANSAHSGSYEFLPAGYLGPFFALPVFIGIAVLSLGLLARTIWDQAINPGSSPGATRESAR